MLTESPAPTMESDRLRLRGHREDDLANCLSLWSEEAVTRFQVGRKLTEEEIWLRMLRHIGHWTLLGYGYWVIEDKSTGTFLGEAGLAEFHRDIVPSIIGTPEAGWVFRSAAQGKGYAFEATRAILTWGEGRFRSDRTVCIIDPENAPSLRLAAKLGYWEEARTYFRDKPTIILGRGLVRPGP